MDAAATTPRRVGAPTDEQRPPTKGTDRRHAPKTGTAAKAIAQGRRRTQSAAAQADATDRRRAGHRQTTDHHRTITRPLCHAAREAAAETTTTNAAGWAPLKNQS